jgi:hypothetical protein
VIECKCGIEIPLDSKIKNNIVHDINGSEYIKALTAESTHLEIPTMWNIFKPLPQNTSRSCGQGACKFKQSKIHS